MQKKYYKRRSSYPRNMPIYLKTQEDYVRAWNYYERKRKECERSSDPYKRRMMEPYYSYIARHISQYSSIPSADDKKHQKELIKKYRS